MTRFVVTDCPCCRGGANCCILCRGSGRVLRHEVRCPGCNSTERDQAALAGACGLCGGDRYVPSAVVGPAPATIDTEINLPGPWGTLETAES